MEVKITRAHWLTTLLFLVCASEICSQENEQVKNDDFTHALELTQVVAGETILIPAADSLDIIAQASSLVRNNGKVYAQITSQGVARKDGALFQELEDFVTDNNITNVNIIVRENENLGLEGQVDLVIVAYSFHDIYYRDGRDASLILLEELYNDLVLGGELLLIDHRGDGSADDAKNHRISKQLLVELVEESGFSIVQDSELLSNPSDPRNIHILDPRVRGNTDRVVLLAKRAP